MNEGERAPLSSKAVAASRAPTASWNVAMRLGPHPGQTPQEIRDADVSTVCLNGGQRGLQSEP